MREDDRAAGPSGLYSRLLLMRAYFILPQWLGRFNVD